MKVTLSFPGPFRLDIALGLAFLLFALQLATGTSLEFAELTFVAVVATVIAVNLLGGLRTLAGWCVALVSLQVFVVAEIAKVYYGEAGQARLEQPLVTMGVIAVSTVSLALGAALCFGFRPRHVLFKPVFDLDLLRAMTVISFLIGLGAGLGGHLSGDNADGSIQLGGVAGLLRRFSSCTPLAIVSGTAYSILQSGGARLFSRYNLVPLLVLGAQGVFYSSKQGMFEPALFLVLTAVTFCFSWRPIHIATGVVACVFGMFVLFPYGQVARNYTRGVTLADTLQRNIDYLEDSLANPGFFLDEYDEYKAGLESYYETSYFEHPNGALERMALIKPADLLVDAALDKGESGWETIEPGVVNLIPHALYSRAFVNTPNDMAYKAGMIDQDDYATPVSFGLAADGFGSFGWTGAVVVPLILGVLLVVITRLLTPPMPGNIWGVVWLAGYYHLIAEASAASVLDLLLYQSAWTVASLYGVVLCGRAWVYFSKGKWLPWIAGRIEMPGGHGGPVMANR